MEKSPSTQQVINEVVKIARQFPEVKLLYFFGSRARGDSGPLSDYDFGVYIDTDKKRVAQILLSLAGLLPKAAKSDAVDLVPLHAADRPELCFRIIMEGVLIYEVSPYRLEVEPRIQNEYFDFKLSQRTHFAV